jgi:hypothetical protein
MFFVFGNSGADLQNGMVINGGQEWTVDDREFIPTENI